MRTSTYGQEDRARLGRAGLYARLALGYRTRTKFVAITGAPHTTVTSVRLLETGQPGVGQVALVAYAWRISWWTDDTPRLILEGEMPPPIPSFLTATPDRGTLSRSLVEVEASLLVAAIGDVSEFVRLYAALRQRYSPDQVDDVVQRVRDLATDQTVQP